MRATSRRRRGSNTNGARQYLGAPDGTPKPSEQPAKVVDPESEGAIECPHCHVYVKATPTGKVSSHAEGGFRTNVKRGRYTCPGVPDLDRWTIAERKEFDK